MEEEVLSIAALARCYQVDRQTVRNYLRRAAPMDNVKLFADWLWLHSTRTGRLQDRLGDPAERYQIALRIAEEEKRANIPPMDWL